MDKLKLHTPNKSDENFAKLAALFPNAVTETIDPVSEAVVRGIDKDILMQEISATVVEGREERYQFTWPDKRKAILAANAPSNKTLRPCRGESAGRDGTPGGFDSENLYIEGDNLEVLKLLQETYLGKVKMIYIDPPYNTGNDFVYNDKFSVECGVWSLESGDYDEDGNRLVKNLDSNGRFHTDWLNMIYPRLKLARDLLTDDGVIFMSIDDNEVENLKKICDEIFGACNFVSQIIWHKKYGAQNDAKWFSTSHDYILVYAKSKEKWRPNLLPRSEEATARYKNPDNDSRGPWKATDFSRKAIIAHTVYDITLPSGRVVSTPSGRSWLKTPSGLQELIDDNRIWFGANGDSVPSVKRFLSEVKDGMVCQTIWPYADVGHTDKAVKDLNEIMGITTFDYPKPIELIKRCVYLGVQGNDIILDFFSGSATTAHAVMQLNAEDGGNRKFIMVQLPEETDEKSEAYKAGYKNICEIGKERIRRAGAKIRLECGVGNMECGVEGQTSLDNNSKLNTPNSTLDTGFRVLKCDSTNMKRAYYHPDDVDGMTIEDMLSNIKADRTPEDLLFQVMLDLGIPLSSEIQCGVWSAECGIQWLGQFGVGNAESGVDGQPAMEDNSTLHTPNSKLFSVAEGYLMACFDDNTTEAVITTIAKQKPYYFVMRDSSMENDCVATNFEQIFATYSKDTIRKVL